MQKAKCKRQNVLHSAFCILPSPADTFRWHGLGSDFMCRPAQEVSLMKSVFATLFVALFVVNTAAFGQIAERKDLQVFNDIADQVNRYTQLTIFDSISAQVTDGRVVLSGWVTMPYKKDDLERRIRKVDGVMTVDNKIGVLPASQFDDELRFRIARAIY